MAHQILFFDLVYLERLEKILPLNEKFKEKALELFDAHISNSEWRCDTFTTLYSDYNLKEDKLFKPLLEEINKHVLLFAKEYGVSPSASLNCVDAWLNVTPIGDYQEYHMHSNSHFSAVYYVSVKPNSGNLVFKRHEASSDMFPLPVLGYTAPNFKTYWQAPINGNLVIIRSNMLHMVEKNKSDANRISIALNFTFE